MSEQENSRSPQSTVVPAGAGAENTEQKQEPQGAGSCPSESSGAGVDSGMGNNVFSSPEKLGDKAVGSMGEGEESASKTEVDCEGQVEQEKCEETQDGLLCPQEVSLPDLKESKVPRDSASPGAEPISGMGASEREAERDKAETEKSVAVSDVQDTESKAGDSRGCDSSVGECKDPPAKLEDNEQGCEKKEETPDSKKDENDTSEPSNTEPSEVLQMQEEDKPGDKLKENNEAELDREGEAANGTTEQDRSRPAVSSEPECEVAPPLPTQNGNAELREDSGRGNAEVREDSGREIECPSVDPTRIECPPVDPTRDTDSEAGDSVCSEDGEHGEVCRGGGGCTHHEADAGWEYVVDEEFNVPRRPVFNGAADHLERRSNLKRRASEESEGKCHDCLLPFLCSITNCGYL